VETKFKKEKILENIDVKTENSGCGVRELRTQLKNMDGFQKFLNKMKITL